MAAVSSATDLAAPSKRSRGLADIDPKFVSNVTKNHHTFLLNVGFFLFNFTTLCMCVCVCVNRVTGIGLSLLLMKVVTRFRLQISITREVIGSKWFSLFTVDVDVEFAGS